MDHTITYEWVKGDSNYQFPASGFLAELEAGETRGGLGFRPGPDGCELWHVATHTAQWKTLIERVTDQARKGKYLFATVAGALPDDLDAALRAAGFSGSPLGRRLAPDAPKELQAYLDWDGKVLIFAAGKGRESINGQLFAHIASRFPSDGSYSEKAVNGLLKQLAGCDHVELRRELVDRGFIGRTRDCTQYWRIERPSTPLA